MKPSVGKPLLSMLTVACIAAPAGVGHAEAAPPEPFPLCAVGADRSPFDTVPAALRWFPATGPDSTAWRVVETLATIGPAVQADIDARAELPLDHSAVPTGITVTTHPSDPTPAADRIDPTLMLELLTFPYHNFYAITTAVGTALNSMVMTALLPVTIGYYVLDNQIDLIEPYIQTTLHNLRTAIPNILTTIRNEIAYDIDLFNQIFDVTPDPTAPAEVTSRVDDETDAEPEQDHSDELQVTTKHDAAEDIQNVDADEPPAEPVDQTDSIDEPETDGDTAAPETEPAEDAPESAPEASTDPTGDTSDHDGHADDSDV
ncbi:hypothetical protein [Mycobacterium sp. 236(2023)]|uniref:hypothetical protein n=1 Tax=Mycobacterium sp. 236(2023) TaxID=3038163 RepID=UPI00241560CD|nr:hypothetical protein [Mycobacterium sp. 236(2023)]MDG4665678.1 hypothetical protein [Mycobacterium sp. 236(2023)]